jgi:hypothetical protein
MLLCQCRCKQLNMLQWELERTTAPCCIRHEACLRAHSAAG